MEDVITGAATHGVVTRQELLAAGLSRPDITRAQEGGLLELVRRGRYLTASADAGVAAAARAGGTLTCLSALSLLGVSTPELGGVHHIRRCATRRRDGEVDGTVECRSTSPIRRDHAVDGLEAALTAAVLNHPAETGLIVLDSILNRRFRIRAELDALFVDLPVHARNLLGDASALAASPQESVVRHRLRRAGVRVRPQPYVPGAGHYDLLVGKRLLIELDGFAYHGDRNQFREDRRRDRHATALGYKVLRFTWEDVMLNWPTTLATILSYVTNDFHRGAPRPTARQAG